MPHCQTKYQGEMDYDEQAELHFELGLFGFESETRFLPIDQPSLRPLVFLQSLTTPDLCLISVPVLVVDRDYVLSLNPEDLEAVGLPSDRPLSIGTDVLCLVIVCIQEGGASTANLLAPVVVNRRNANDIQAISTNRKHTHRVPLPALSEARKC